MNSSPTPSAHLLDRPRHLMIWAENYWIGGCDRFLVDLIADLNERSIRVTLAGNPHTAFDEWLRERVPSVLPRTVIPVANLVRTPLHRLDRFRRDRVQMTTTGPAVTDPQPVRAALAALRYSQAGLNLVRLRRLLRRVRPDVLLINNGGYPGGESCRMASLAAGQLGIPAVHFVHNMAHPPAWPEHVERRLDRLVDSSIRLWITAAHRASDELSRQRGIDRGRIHTVHYGIALPDKEPRERVCELRAELGFDHLGLGLAVVANQEPRKGLLILLDALSQLHTRGVDVRVAFVGDGPQHELLKQRVRELELADRVRFLGWRNDVDDILARADALALPSLANECLPYVVLEAMACGLPVIATDVAGVPEMINHGANGYVVAPGDADALAGALAELASDRDLGRRMGEAGRSIVISQFTRQSMVGAMLEKLGFPAGEPG